MTLKNVAIKGILSCSSLDLRSLARFAVTLAIGVGWLALLALLDHGGAFLVRTLGPALANIDQPLPDPGDDYASTIDSAAVMASCAAIGVIAELLRRRQRGAREPA